MTNYPDRYRVDSLKGSGATCPKCGSTKLVIVNITENKGWGLLNCNDCRHTEKIRIHQG